MCCVLRHATGLMYNVLNLCLCISLMSFHLCRSSCLLLLLCSIKHCDVDINNVE